MGVGRILHFLQELAGLVIMSAEVGGIGQALWSSVWNKLHLANEEMRNR